MGMYENSQFDRFGFDKEGYNKAGFNRLGYNREGYDKDGFDINGFNKNGIGKLTGRDQEGFDSEGFNVDGYDREGFDRSGYGKDGYDRNGFNSEGFSRDGYNREGFDKYGFNRDGYDQQGYNKEGYNEKGFDRKGFDKEGYDEDGFNASGLDREGYDRKGFKDGYDREGFDITGFNIDGYNRLGYDHDGYNREGFDKWGFNREKITREGYNIFGYGSDGYNILGFDREGFDRDKKSPEGFDRNMFDEEGYHIFSGYNLKGINREGFSVNGYDRNGYDEDGYHYITGLNREGFNREGYNREGFDKEGFNSKGYDRNGFDREGYDKDGFDQDHFDRKGFDRDGFDKDGYDINGYNKDGELNPKLKNEDELDSKISEDSLERQFFGKCIAQIKGYYKNRIREKEKENFKPTERRYIDRWGFVHTEIEYPDPDLLEKNVSKKVNPVLKNPYFAHVNYSGNPELYIGKVAVHGWVTDWADSRAQYYYQYPVFIGDKKINYEYVRDINISDGKYKGYKTLFAKTSENKDDILQVADERLQQIIRANRKNKKIHDIIESIQRNQYKIITDDINKSMLVLGCAGSGKTMILMHKIRYAKYNNSKISMGDFIVISPTDVLGKESRQLSRLLQIGKINQFTTASFYKNVISDYLTKNNVEYEKYIINDNGKIYTSYYDRDLLDDYCSRIDEILQYHSKEAKKFIDSEYTRLTDIMASFYPQLGKDRDYFVSTQKIYESATKEIGQVNKNALTNLIFQIDKELRKLENIENYKAIMERMLLLPDIPQSRKVKKKNEDNISKKYFYTRKIADLTDSDSFYRIVITKDIQPQNIAELLLILQCLSEEPLEGKDVERLLKEWDETSKEEILEYLKYLDEEFKRLRKLEEKKHLFELFINSDFIVDNKIDIKELNPNDTFDNVLELARRTEGILDNGIFDAFELFYAYKRVSKKRLRVSAQRGSNKKNQYLFDSILSILNVKENDDMSYELNVSQAFAATYILNKKFGSLNRNKRYIFVDEFQDYSPIELLTFKKIYPLGQFNLFGDVKQCINEKGIDTVLNVPKELYNQKVYKINENYRNAIQITQYVNKYFKVGMNPVGLEGTVNEVKKLNSLSIAEDDRVALIVNNSQEIMDSTYFNDYMTSREIKRGCINIIPIFMAKGLEFESVLVGGRNFTDNEFYVACTRAINNLIIIDDFKYEDLKSFKLSIDKNN